MVCNLNLTVQLVLETRISLHDIKLHRTLISPRQRRHVSPSVVNPICLVAWLA